MRQAKSLATTASPGKSVFALGWFLGRYTINDSANYCTMHRERIELLRKLLAKVGVVSMHDISLLSEPPPR